MLNNILSLFLGIGIGFLIVIIIKSIYIPGARKIYAIMLSGKLYTFIINIEGKKIYDGPTIPENNKWDIIDLPQNETERFNFYFFLWPFFKVYTYPLTYIKEKMIGEEQEGDIVIWKDEGTKRCLVSRSGISDHLEWRVDYPTITANLDTKELAPVNTYTNNMLEVINPEKALFGIKDWYQATSEILHGGLRSLVSRKKLHDLNQYSSEKKEEFNTEMRGYANKNSTDDPGLPIIGFSLFRSVFKDFDPANDTARELMKSYAEVTIAEEKGNAKLITAQKDVEVAKEKAKAYAEEQGAIVTWRKKYLIDTGLAKVDANGNIIELIPDANTKITAEAMKEWSKISGTLVIDSGPLNKIFSITPTKKETGDNND